MKNSKFTLPMTALALVSSNVLAAGLSLSQIGTASSIATAGVAGVTNNQDASATVTNAAGLAGIEDSSLMLGGQLLNVKSQFDRDDQKQGTTSEGNQFIPHISYAKRLNEDWVAGVALHSPGGLGVAYSNGLSGGELNIVQENKITMLNLTASAAYQVNDKLSLGAGLIAQYAGVEVLAWEQTIQGSSINPTFSLSSQYQLSEQTRFGFNYQHGTKHDITLENNPANLSNMAINWPATVEFGISQKLSENLTLLASSNWQSWSDYDVDYDNTFGAGLAAQYQMGSWLLQTGFSMDSSPVDKQHRDVALPLDKQWRLGLGAEKTLKSGSKFAIAYQFQHLGDGEIESQGFEPLRANGAYSENRVHFITFSYHY